MDSVRKKTSLTSFSVALGKNSTPHNIYESRGNGNGITCPSIKDEERKCCTKIAHFFPYFVYFSENHLKKYIHCEN